MHAFAPPKFLHEHARYFTPFAPYVHVAFDYFTPVIVKGGHRTRIGAAPYYAPFTLYVHVAFDHFTSAVVYP